MALVISLRSILSSVICLLAGFAPIVAEAFSGNLDFMLNRSSCSGCHSSATAPSPATTQALRVKDVETENLVTQYEPGKTYAIQILFSPQLGLEGKYRVAYFLRSKTASGSALGEFTTPATIATADGSQTAPDRIYKPQSHEVARVFTSPSQIASSALTLLWKAPQSSEAVRFEFARVEANNNGGNDAGDRGSSSIEVVTLTSTGLPDSNGDQSPTDRASNFDENLSGGCGILKASHADKRNNWFQSLFVLALLMMISLRGASKKLSDQARS